MITIDPSLGAKIRAILNGSVSFISFVAPSYSKVGSVPSFIQALMVSGPGPFIIRGVRGPEEAAFADGEVD